ncbi:major facilitator superfamily transporter, partial [Leptodontidium sp. 2 PMI_412]
MSTLTPMSTNLSSKRDSSQIPGTVYLITSNGEVLRLPIPSNSPQDPLNWGMKKRALAFLALASLGSTSLIVVQGASSMFSSLSKEFTLEDTYPFNLTVLATAPPMFMGIGAFLWIPLSLALGRRLVVIMAATMLVMATIWASVEVNFHVLLAAVCFEGLAAGVTSSALLLIIIDLTFIHERPAAIAGTYGIITSLGSGIFTFTPQFANTGVAWRTFYRILIIPCVVSLLLVLFLYPETYFVRPGLALDGRILVQSATEKVYLYDDDDQAPDTESKADQPGKSLLRFRFSDLKIWRTTGSLSAMVACYRQMLLCFINPLIFWVALLQATVFGSLVSTSETYVVVLSSEPYSLSMHQIALFNLAGGFGAILAWPISAYTITAVSRLLTRKNKGVCDAEYYLPAFILPILTAAGGSFLYGYAIEYKWHWSWIYLSSALGSFSIAGLGTANTLWITEAFPRWAGPALAVVAGVGYTLSFCITFAIMPWLEVQGYGRVNGQIGGIILAVGFVGVPISFWGKKLRQHIHGRWAVCEAGALRP